MNVLNAISKVRFSSARPQRVQLAKCPVFVCDLLCLEPQQEISGAGRCTYYVIAGTGEVRSGRECSALTLGNFVCLGDEETHLLRNCSDQRLIALAIAKAA